MATILSPGIYPERLPGGGAQPTMGVATATLVVPGYYTDGPSDKLFPVYSWVEFERVYGGLNSESDNGYAIKGYFENGGNKVIPLRVCETSAKAASDATSFTGWTVTAVNKGVKYNGIKVQLTESLEYTGLKDMAIATSEDEVLEYFAGVSFLPADSAKATYAPTKINDISAYIKLSGTGDLTLTGEPKSLTATLAGGSNGKSPVDADYLASLTTALTPGSSLLDNIDGENILLICPDFPTKTVHNLLITYANFKKYAYVLTTPDSASDNPTKAVTYKTSSTGGSLTLDQKAAMYWPWVKIYDPNRKGIRSLNPLGHIAGVYARTDQTKNVGKNPAGTVDGQLRGIVGLSYEPNQGERDSLYPNRINPLIASLATGVAVWGCRSLSTDPEWIYVNHERLFQFVESSVYRSLFWVVFENNGPDLQLRVYSQINMFMLNLFNTGHFAGTKPDEAYYVICDKTNNPQESVDAGYLNIDIGIACNKPAEFVRLRLRQKTLK